MFDRYTYICLADRFTSKYPGSCAHCADTLLGLYDFRPPRKHDDRGWKKIELMILEWNSGIQLCGCLVCVPLGRPHKKGLRYERLTLSQYKASIRKRRLHHQGEVPKYRYNYI